MNHGAVVEVGNELLLYVRQSDCSEVSLTNEWPQDVIHPIAFACSVLPPEQQAKQWRLVWLLDALGYECLEEYLLEQCFTLCCGAGLVTGH